MSAAFTRRLAACLVTAFAVSAAPALALDRFDAQPPELMSDGTLAGRPTTGAPGITESVAAIMAREAARGAEQRAPRRSIEHESRRHPVENVDAPGVARWPLGAGTDAPARPDSPQTVGTQFLGATLAETGAFPPDTMGAVGPTQFIVAVNGRIRSFNKSNGAADGALNADTDVFFASVMTPIGGGITSNFTSDPRIRYDRLSRRWYVVIIDVPNGGAAPNRALIAVSNTATITSSTNFTFYWFQFASSTLFADYPTLGIDANALYLGANMFDATSGAFVNTYAAVVRKSSLAGPSPITATIFPNLLNGSFAGPYTPQGVDNYDPAATQGYFVGVDGAAYGLLQLRRVSTPGGTPTLSANIPLTVPQTGAPLLVQHLGNTGGNNGRLDALDDRLFAAHVRNGRLWTAHSIGTNASGIGVGTGTPTRTSTRWYEIGNLAATPTLVQSGTVFDTATTNPLSFWISSVMVSGQGHAALGFSVASANTRVDAATVGRLASDTLGTQGTTVRYTASTTAYNPPSDPGGAGGRRWGDYSYTSLDPCDDMTMWTIQQFVNATNSYGVQAAKLLAPAPTLSCAAATTVNQGATANVTLTGTGFYDPPAGIDTCRVGLAAAAAGTGVTVNSATFNSATSVTLNVTVGAGATTGPRSLTVTNPDGQAASNSNCLTIGASGTTIASLARSSADPVCATGNVSWQATFAQSVSGLAPGNFSLSGGTGAAITGVTGSGTTWTVNANSGTAAATLGLSMANSGGTTPSVTNTPFAGQSFTVNALPTLANVSGGGAFCAGGAGVPVNLSGSQVGVNYQLRRDGNAVGAPFAGTGSAIAFGNQGVAGTYTVDATNATTACAAPMSGNAVVTVNAVPSLNPVAPAPICTGGTTNIALTSTPAGATFAWSASLANGSVSGFADGTGSTIAQTLTGGGQVTYTVSPTLGSCAAGGSPVQQSVSDPAIAPATLPNGTTVAAYNQALTSPGAVGGVTFAVTAGTFPPGLALAPSGAITGTPTADGSYGFTVTATGVGVAGCNAQRSYTIVVGDVLLSDGFE